MKTNFGGQKFGGSGYFPGTCSGMVDPTRDPEWHECMLWFIDDMREKADRLRDQGYSFSLIDPEPMMIPSFDLDDFIDRPTKAI